MLETIKELQRSKEKGGGLNQKKSQGSNEILFPKMIIIGNKKDLIKNKNAGSLGKEDIEKLE
jgi:hypothetical protein